MNNASISITRTSEYSNKLRDFSLYLDGVKADNIGNDATKIIHTTAGNHTLEAKVDWCGSEIVSIRLAENEQKAMVVSGFKYNKWIMNIGPGIVGIHFLLKIFFNFHYLIFFIIPFFFLLMYYLTIGRRKYLILKEVTTGV